MTTESPRDTGTNMPVEQSGAPGEGDPTLERKQPAAEQPVQDPETTAELPVVAPETAASQTVPVAAPAQPAPAAVEERLAQGSPAGSAERPANRSKRTEQFLPLPLDPPAWARARKAAAGEPPMVGVQSRRRRPSIGVLVGAAAVIVALVAVALAVPSLTGSPKTTTAPTVPAGQTGGASQTSQAGAAAGTGAVQAVRQGFTQLPPEPDGDAKVIYAVVLRNPRNDQVAVDVRAVLTFTGANGAAVTVKDEGLDALLPGQSAAVADTTSAAGVTGLRVQILVGSWAPAQGLAGNLSAEGVRTSVVAGKLTTTATLRSTLGQPLSGADVVAVYYDQAGRIIGGQADSVDVVPAGGSVPVLLDTSTTLAGVAKSEVYANPKDLLTPGG